MVSMGIGLAGGGPALAEARNKLAPGYDVLIAESFLGPEITRFVESLEYETADGIADVAKLTIANPDGIFTDSTLWQPGNEMDVYAGYADRVFLGRVQLVRPEYNFPRSGMPTIKVTGYSKDHTMMDNSAIPKGKGKEAAKKGKKKGARKPGERRWAQVPYSQVVKDKATQYGWLFDVDDTPGKVDVVQKPGLTDYDMVKGIANITGFLFWVDYDDESGDWMLHFKNPAKTQTQDKKYTLKYNAGDLSTLLDFSPSLAIRDVKTNLIVETRDPVTGKTLTEKIEEEAESPDLAFDGKIEASIEEPHTSGAAVRLFFGDASLDVQTNKRFKDGAQLKAWAKQWFARHREQFIVGDGNAIGIEDLKARQTHRIEGIGKTLDGDYYFARVCHKFTKSYETNFTAHRVIG